MKDVNFSAGITLIANLGVIAGLIFLAYEIRQNTAQMPAEAACMIRTEHILEKDRHL